MLKIVTVIGARPQFIKAATVSRVVRQRPDVREVIVHTGQHYDANMSAVFFGELDIPEPDFNLGIGGSLHGAMTGRQLEGIEGVLLKEKPDWVLVYGDTNSTLAGALAAAKLHIPVAHVEAGLRSFNRRMPEEINRVLTDHCADLLFAPTETAVRNLEREGVDGCKVQLVGDVMYDAALYYGKRAEARRSLLGRLGLVGGDYVLVTVHRAENTDDPARLRNIAQALVELAKETSLVFPLHPRTKGAFADAGLTGLLEGAGVSLLDPVGYLEMVLLEKHAALVLTDSGGVQKEAYFHEVPCVTLRDETEWVELVEAGWNQLASPEDPARIVDAVRGSLGRRGAEESLYGAGDAAEGIVAALVSGR